MGAKVAFVSSALALQGLFLRVAPRPSGGGTSSFLPFTLRGQRNPPRATPPWERAVSQGENGSPVSCQGCPAEGWG